MENQGFKEAGNTLEISDATMLRGSGQSESSSIQGTYFAKCIGEDGSVKWEDTIHNVITNVGKNQMLDVALGTSAAVVGPYMGIISSVSYTGVPVVGDTMSSHSTWVEAGSASNYPLYTGTRKTCVWSAAASGSKSLSAALSFVCATTGGTVKGCFLVYGSGAVSTIADTNGVLYSAGVFTGGDKVMSVGDTLQISFSTSI